MPNKAQTMLTVALSVAVSALLVDRIVPIAEAENADSRYVLIGHKGSKNGNALLAHDFSSKASCEAARDWKELKYVETGCFPK